MKLAAVQFKPDPKGDVAGALARLADLTREAAPGADLVVLPEMCATGYIFADRAAIEPFCEPADGPTLAALRPVAREHRTWLVAGFPERDADKRFNSALVIDPTGDLRFVYRKTLLFEADHTWCDVGDSGYAAFDADFGRFTVGICMDINDDAFITHLEETAADVLAFPTNWTDEGHRVWGYWAWRMQTVEDTALVAANTWGVEEDGTGFRGESCVLWRRTIYAAAPHRGDGVIGAELGR